MRTRICTCLLPLLLLALPACVTTPDPAAEAAAQAELKLPTFDFSGDVFYDFNSRASDYPKLAVLPFKAAVELAGESVSDVFTTELLKTARYELVERNQIESVLKEQELSLSGLIDAESLALQIGKILGVRGVVVGTLSEYGFKKSGIRRAPSIGVTARMIDTSSGKIVWSASHSVVGDADLSLSLLANNVAEEMVTALSVAWIDAGEGEAVGIPPPSALVVQGGLREVELSWTPHRSKQIAGYELCRHDDGTDTYRILVRLRNTREATMRYTDRELLDLTAYRYRIRAVSKFGLVSTGAAKAEAITMGPPAPPATVDVESGLIRRVCLRWKRPDDTTVAGYRVERRNDAGGFEQIARIDRPNQCEYVDGEGRRPLRDATAYTYRVACFNRYDQTGGHSAAVTGTTLPRPGVVQEVQAQSGLPARVRVTWAVAPAAEQIAAYVIQRAEKAEGPYREIGRATGALTSDYEDAKGSRHAVLNGKTYFYKIAACNAGDVAGEPSAVASATTKPGPPVVQGLRASTDEARQISLQWEPLKTPGMVEYWLYRSRTEGAHERLLDQVNASRNAYVDESLSDSTEYFYRVTGVDVDGLEGEPTAAVSGETKPPPDPPVEVRCTPNGTSVAVAWIASPTPDVERYVVYQQGLLRSTLLGESAGKDYEVHDLKPGKKYKFTVVAIDKDGLRSNRSRPAWCLLPN